MQEQIPILIHVNTKFQKTPVIITGEVPKNPIVNRTKFSGTFIEYYASICIVPTFSHKERFPSALTLMYHCHPILIYTYSSYCYSQFFSYP